MTDRIETLLDEQRSFPPPDGCRARAWVRDLEIYERARKDREGYWADWARELQWIKPWDRVLEWKPPHAKWFLGGKLNASANCLDRHVAAGRGDRVALIWEGEPGEVRRITYAELLADVGRFANVLKSLGIQKGDRVAIYLPMVPEVAVAMLACARLGAPHTVVFGGFSAESLRDRINDAGAKVLVTADGGYRRGSVVPLKQNADEALTGTPSIQKAVVLKRTGQTVPMQAGRDLWWDELMATAQPECPPEAMDAEDPLYILYTSGTTGKPKGILHTTGGYLTHVYATTKWVFDLGDSDVFWCTADVGWVTGHSYVVYGPLALGVTEVMYEGAPDYPGKDRFWQICARHGVTVFYTAPTAIRAFMKWGTDLPAKHDLSKLRLLGTVGEPINPEAWMWYHTNIGRGRCPIVDTWWQTETGGIMITPLPGAVTCKPGSATIPFPGIEAQLLDGDGKPVQVGGGYLAITSPWPGMLRTIWGDDERYRQVYWSRWPGTYFPGDGAKRDSDGYYWILGRVDDVLNVAGHRIGTMEVESALVDNPMVAEAAAVGVPHPLKGQALVVFVTLREG
ncbi:MAG TPA: acetate--CoA ligase, partial [Gemmatimonadales bacterium]